MFRYTCPHPIINSSSYHVYTLENFDSFAPSVAHCDSITSPLSIFGTVFLSTIGWKRDSLTNGAQAPHNLFESVWRNCKGWRESVQVRSMTWPKSVEIAPCRFNDMVSVSQTSVRVLLATCSPSVIVHQGSFKSFRSSHGAYARIKVLCKFGYENSQIANGVVNVLMSIGQYRASRSLQTSLLFIVDMADRNFTVVKRLFRNWFGIV